ncbi:hypothetical protein J7T55_011991 [Diaporthe amygdali]|uniref:uncharacterized protein n=1 Tax=Phomopsis amygdali TaxID=1214568 RepID=UPI0022FDDDFA|nr:uncharacterized protein J7T55_011991 [Diaporthe amygdali]KAJ0123526.1 hypothetical protein J7T55_011991 [Diaporthe amygdali]
MQFFIGTAQVQVKNLFFDSSSREKIERACEQLAAVFEDGCNPFADDNRIPVALFPEELAIVLRESMVSMQDLVSPQNPNLKLYPSNGIRCVHGRQRFETAIRVKGPEYWWGIRIYCIPRGSEIWRLLYNEVDQYYYQTQPTDGEVFLKVRQYMEAGEPQWAARSRKKLSPCKQTALKAIEAKGELLEKLDQLRRFPGLWDDFNLGNIEKYLALHIMDEILHHLQHIYDFWARVTLYEPQIQEATSRWTVKTLELRAPGCKTDREAVRQFMGAGLLFERVSQPAKRQKIQQEIFSMPRLIIPSFRTFRENMNWLTVGVQILKDEIIDKAGKRTVQQAMRDCWKPPERCLVEVGRDDYIEIPVPPVFELAYRQVLVAALRGFPNLSSVFAPRREKGQKRRTAGIDDAHLAAFLRGAQKQGFQSAKIRTGLLRTRGANPKQDSVESRGEDPGHVGARLERRCGRPFANTYAFLESRLFITNLLTLDESPMDYPSSLFVQRDFLRSFFASESPWSPTAPHHPSQAVPQPLDVRVSTWTTNRSMESRSIFTPRSLAAALGPPPLPDAEAPEPLHWAHPPHSPHISALSTSTETSFSSRSIILPELMRTTPRPVPTTSNRAARIWRQRPSIQSSSSTTSEGNSRSIFGPDDLMYG